MGERLPSDISVARWVLQVERMVFAKNGGYPVNGVLARLLEVRKLQASPVLRHLSIQVSVNRIAACRTPN